MRTTKINRARKLASCTLVLAVGMSLSACGGMPTNRSLESLHQPVVERTNYALDVATGSGGLAYPEQRRLAGWFEAMNLRYGDRVAIDDPLGSPDTRAIVEAIASRYGILLGDDVPVTAGYVNAGTARVIVSRLAARVPGCPDWSAKSDVNLNNATTSNFGCGVNSNLAAMVANPEHLVKGAEGDATTVVMSSNKAIDSYRQAKPTGEDGLKANATQSGGK
ncbi:MAG: CpaD family pilus assembly protein [Novosphingobium sp.]